MCDVGMCHMGIPQVGLGRIGACWGRCRSEGRLPMACTLLPLPQLTSIHAPARNTPTFKVIKSWRSLHVSWRQLTAHMGKSGGAGSSR